MSAPTETLTPESTPAPVARAPLRRGTPPAALMALLRLALAQQCRFRRLMILVLLYAAPTAFALLARWYGELEGPADREDAQLALIYYLIPNALVPLTALLAASGMIQDEVEDQTLTYLLIRPLPRWSIYLMKLLAVVLVGAALAAVFTTTAFAAVFWDDPELWPAIVPGRALRTAALLALSLAAYAAIFGLLSLFVRRSLALGVAYIVVLEGAFANFDFVARRLTVMYYFRVLVGRWIGLEPPAWSIDLEAAPTSTEAALTLAAVAVVAAAVAAFAFTVREFRVKTPEGS